MKGRESDDYGGHFPLVYEGVSKSLRTGRLERELQMLQLSAPRCSSIAILWASLVSFAVITLCVASQRVFYYYLFIYLWLSPETIGYTLVCLTCRFESRLDSHLHVIDYYYADDWDRTRNILNYSWTTDSKNEMILDKRACWVTVQY
jgi:hypothetical protein